MYPNPSSSSTSTTTTTTTLSPTKTRQYSHLHAQLAQLNAHLADTQNLMRMTSAQAGDMRFLGGYVGSLFMGAAKVLGEDGVVSGKEKEKEKEKQKQKEEREKDGKEEEEEDEGEMSG